MQDYHVKLECTASESFRCAMAANSLDIDVSKKLVHELNISADLKTPWNVGLIIGASGSGKTTLAKHIFGDKCFEFGIDESKTVLDQFPDNWSYEQCQNALNGIGLSQVPCWIKPIATLSNGQKSRAIAALQLASNSNLILDEWTSVVDRTVAKAMSHSLQKHARSNSKQVVAVSCHYDVADWLNPDWVIDCNKSAYIDRRLLWRNFERPEKLQFDIRTIGRESWGYFSKYHYLSEKLPGGHVKFFGLFAGEDQIGFVCYANYVPWKKGEKIKMHMNRIVIHPDYTGLGLGIKFIERTARVMHEEGAEVWSKFSSVPIARCFSKSPNWVLVNVQRFRKSGSDGMQRKTGFRNAIKTYSYRFNPVLPQ